MFLFKKVYKIRHCKKIDTFVTLCLHICISKSAAHMWDVFMDRYVKYRVLYQTPEQVLQTTEETKIVNFKLIMLELHKQIYQFYHKALERTGSTN